jgi:hypothetical protein
MLGWLAGASHIDLCFCWGISIGTFYNKDRGPIWPTIEAINLAFDIGLPLHDASQLDELAKGFYYHSGDILDGCVITVDGLAAHPQQPYDYKVWKEDYRFRKGGLTIIVIAGCDVDCCFVVVSCKHSGSWQHINLYNAVEFDNKLPAKCFFLGNEAFTCTNPFLSPWPGMLLCFFV